MWNSTSTNPAARYDDPFITNTPTSKPRRPRQKSPVAKNREMGLQPLGQGNGRHSFVLAGLVGAVVVIALYLISGANSTASASLGAGSVTEVPARIKEPKKIKPKAKPASGDPVDNIPPATAKEYIEKYAPIAVTEQRKYGIPASITLAQGLLESNAGTSGLVLSTNNHFGLKCFSRGCKTGHCVNWKDDTHKDFFKIFPNAWGSYREHSLFLKNTGRYKSLFRLGNDYSAWADGLQKAGYATANNYASGLKALIKRYKLDQYDG